MNIKIVGLGGIGSHLTEWISRYLHFKKSEQKPVITLIDGDQYEEKNRGRQQFVKKGNKAQITAELMREKFPAYSLFRVKEEYITPNNVISLIREDDIVFLCVDNHATRKIVSDRCGELENVVLISGGNDYIDGNVIYYCRRDGKDVTKPLTALDPKIAQPQDSLPGENRSGCQEEVESEPQLLFANIAAASHMCNVYLAHEQGRADFEQVYFDIATQSARATPERALNFEEDEE